MAKFPWRLRGRHVNALIKRVQRGTVVMAGATTATATILAVDMANTRLVMTGCTSDSGAATAPTAATLIQLTTATTVQGSQTTAGNNNVVYFEVIEYWPGVMRSVERGLGSATLVTPVGPGATIDYLGFVTPSAGGTAAELLASVSLTTPTTVTQHVAGGATVSWQVVDWL